MLLESSILATRNLTLDDALAAGQVPDELQLDLVEAATRRDRPPLKQAIERFLPNQPTGDVLAPHRIVLTGGDAEQERNVFSGHCLAQCLRCHKTNGNGRAECHYLLAAVNNFPLPEISRTITEWNVTGWDHLGLGPFGAINLSQE
jgi:hypothetical protein